MENSFIEILVLIVVFLPAIIIHEIAHAYAAYLLGDSTGKVHGRLSLNPLNHLDIFGTIAIFLVGIGWAKPVPINPANFKHPRRDIALSSLAGPMSNFGMALLSGFCIAMLQYLPLNNITGFVFGFFNLFLWVNVILMIFNLLPIPPLDGSGVLGYFIPKQFRQQWYEFEKYGPMILIIIIAIQMFFHIPIFSTIIFYPADKLTSFILLISGVN